MGAAACLERCPHDRIDLLPHHVDVLTPGNTGHNCEPRGIRARKIVPAFEKRALRERRPEIGGPADLHARERGRSNADDGERTAVEINDPIAGLRAVEPLPPHALGNDHGRRGIGAIVAAGQTSPKEKAASSATTRDERKKTTAEANKAGAIPGTTTGGTPAEATTSPKK